MNCKQALLQLDDYLDRDLPMTQLKALQQHLDSCQHCRSEFDCAEDIQQALFELPVPQPNSDFPRRAFSFLQEKKSHKQKSHHSHWLAAAGGAIAATFALWLVFNPGMQQSVPSVETVKFQIEPNRVQTVSMVFNSPMAIEDATLRIDLPDNLQLAGAPKRRVIEWKTALKKGSNRLSLPLIATDSRNARLVTRITHGQKAKTFHVDVIPKASSQSQWIHSYQITI